MNATTSRIESAPIASPPKPSVRDSLISTVLAAHDAGARDTAPERIAAVLQRAAGRGEIRLPERFRVAGEKKYARRLLHRDLDRDLVLIAMAWGPGQGTPLHDHGGFWCIEALVDGELESDIYRPVERREDGAVRFQWLERELQRAGSVAVLRPPVEHHVVRNCGAKVAVTLNVYGGELTRCETFRPLEYDWYRGEERRLGYDD